MVYRGVSRLIRPVATTGQCSSSMSDPRTGGSKMSTGHRRRSKASSPRPITTRRATLEVTDPPQETVTAPRRPQRRRLPEAWWAVSLQLHWPLRSSGSCGAVGRLRMLGRARSNVPMRRKWVMAQVRTQLEALQNWRPLVKRSNCTQIRPSQSSTARRQHPWSKEDKSTQLAGRQSFGSTATLII
jgi:hypothetical protein